RSWWTAWSGYALYADIRVAHPELPGSRRDDVLAVGRPDRRREVDSLALRHDVRPRAVRVCDPHVLRAVSVAHEDDLRSVRRIARLLIPAHAAGDARRLAAGD